MIYSYLLHPLIRQDYHEAYQWYEEQQKGLGEKFIKAVRQTIEQIIVHPEIYGSRTNKKFREIKVDYFPYLIVYKINKQKKIVYIVSIHHTKKHPGKKYRS
jgi:plasmid stabilization system protein ParE